MTGLALFDLDNTLVDRQAAFGRWCEDFVREHSLPREAIARLLSLDDNGFARREHVFEGVRSSFGLREPVEALVADYRTTYPTYFHPDPQVNGALWGLKALGWTIGVVTNGPPSQRVKLERAGLVDQVDGLFISDEIGSAKPDRRIFDEAVRQCLGPGSAIGPRWMVGDTAVPDIAGGIGAGLKTIWLHHGRRWEQAEYRPDAEVANVAEAVHVMIGTSESADG